MGVPSSPIATAAGRPVWRNAPAQGRLGRRHQQLLTSFTDLKRTVAVWGGTLPTPVQRCAVHLDHSEKKS